MTKLLVLLMAILLVGLGSGLTVMQEAFSAQGTTEFYEKDVAHGVGGQVLYAYNQGNTTIQKAIIADLPGPVMSVTEKVVMVPVPPPQQNPDPIEFMGMWWGPNSQAKLNQTIWFENTDHHTVFTQTGQGTYKVLTQGDTTISTLRNKQFAPVGKQLLPPPKLEPIPWPTKPPLPIDP